MTRDFPVPVARLAEALVDQAGGYLRNTLRITGETCLVCSTPIQSNYQRCFQCQRHTDSGFDIADRVASMVYAIKPRHELDQMYKTMYGYKASPPIMGHQDIVASLLALGLRGHSQCELALGRVSEPARTFDYRWAIVPSTRDRLREHPLHALVTRLAGATESEVRLRPRDGIRHFRALDPENFQVLDTLPSDAHVAVIDDSWVQGGHAQSVAAALKRAGAASVSILTVARVLDPDFGPNPEFIRRRLARVDFDPKRCPWTGSDCPEGLWDS